MSPYNRPPTTPTTNDHDDDNGTAAGHGTTTMVNPDLLAVRNYITGADHRRYNNIDPDIVIVDLSHSNLQQRHIEIRFYKHNTIDELRSIIHQKTGTSHTYQRLFIYDIDHTTHVATIEPNTYDNYKLGYFNIEYHGMLIHCIDTNPLSLSAGGGLEDVSLVPKYKLTDQQYDSKPSNTVRSWARQQRTIDPTFTLKKHAKQHAELITAIRLHKQGLPLPTGFVYDETLQKVVAVPDQSNDDEQQQNEIQPPSYGVETIQHIVVDARCQVIPGKRRGRVAYVGEIDTTVLPGGGYWVGIIFDEPVGKNDGSIHDQRYFTAPGPKYGSFVRGPFVEIGDYPERNIFDSDNDDDDDDDDDEI